jgi:hypothetical protein
MKDLRVFFLDWYDWIMPGSSSDNIFIWILKKHFNVILDDKNPDVLFYSLYYNRHLEYKNCLKIYVNSEPLAYNNLELYDENLRHVVSIRDADYIITSYKSNIEKNYYMPIFLLWLYHHYFVTTQIKSLDSLVEYRNIDQRNNFCIFLHNNGVPERRRVVFDKLIKYKFINTKNNFYIPDGTSNKINSLKTFKFSFAMQNHYYKENFENYNVPGLIDEKIIESLISGTIPLYYGNENVGDYLNKDAILNYHDFNNDDSFVEEIIKIDSNYGLYTDIASQPIVKNLESLQIQELENFLLKIIK